jgi:AraC-like DNA-binding protein
MNLTKATLPSLEVIEIEYQRESPSSILRLLRSNSGSVIRHNNFKEVIVKTENVHLETIHKKISEGFWYLRTEHYYPNSTRINMAGSESEDFYELEYFFVDKHKITQTDRKGKFSLESKAVFSSSVFSRIWEIEKDTRMTVYKFIFTKEFLEENFYVDEPLLQHSIFQKIINVEEPCYNRQIFPQELTHIAALEKLVNTDNRKLLQTIWIKSAVLQLFGQFFELQSKSAEHYAEKANIFADAIIHMKARVDEAFPGLEELAAITHVSVPTFKRKFKSFFLTTPEIYFRELQMEQAESYLKMPGITVKEVAGYFGYIKLQSFKEAFKKVKGYFPCLIFEPLALDYFRENYLFILCA